MTNTNTCEVPALGEDSFDELKEAMASNLYWVRFFARPCCPAPDAEGACKMLDHLKADVEARNDFTAAQKAEIEAVIEERKGWYPTSGLCKH